MSKFRSLPVMTESPILRGEHNRCRFLISDIISIRAIGLIEIGHNYTPKILQISNAFFWLILFRMFVQVTLRKAIYAKFKKKTRSPLSQNKIQFWEIADIWQWMVLRQNKLVISVQKLHLQSQTQRGRKQHDFKHGFIFVHNLLSKWKSDNKIVSKTCWHTETHGRPYQYTQTRK